MSEMRGRAVCLRGMVAGAATPSLAHLGQNGYEHHGVCAVPFAHVIRSWIYTDKWEIPVRSMMCMYVLDRGDAYLD